MLQISYRLVSSPISIHWLWTINSPQFLSTSFSQQDAESRMHFVETKSTEICHDWYLFKISPIFFIFFTKTKKNYKIKMKFFLFSKFSFFLDNLKKKRNLGLQKMVHSITSSVTRKQMRHVHVLKVKHVLTLVVLCHIHVVHRFSIHQIPSLNYCLTQKKKYQKRLKY